MDRVDSRRVDTPVFRTIEGLRFISSIGIVAIHMLPHAGVPVPVLFNLFVDLFFVISGIVIGSHYSGAIVSRAAYRDFVQRRLARLYPLHIATLLFYVLLGALALRLRVAVPDPERFAPGQILPNLLLTHAWFPWGKLSYNFVSWSISAEMFVYLAFPLTSLLVARRAGGGLAAVGLMLAAAVATAEFYMGRELTQLTWDFGVVRAVPGFAFGVWLAAFLPRHAADRPARSTRLFHLLLALVLAGMLLDVDAYLELAFVYLLVALAYLTDLRGLPTLPGWRPISRHGELTYSLYMLHVPVTTVLVSFLFPRLLGRSPVAGAVGMVMAIAALFIVARLSHDWFEQPLRRLLNGRPQARPQM